MVQLQIHPPLIARGVWQDAEAARQPLKLEILVRNREGEPFGHIAKWKGRCLGMNAAASMRRSESYCGLLRVRSSMAECTAASLPPTPKRTMGVQIAPGLPVPLYWPCLLNMRCITGRCWFKSSQGCSCSHSSIGSECHSAKVEVDRSNRSESASQNGFWKGG